MKLVNLIIKYIDYRKSFGEKFQTNEKCLKSFCHVMGKNCNLKDVRSKNINNFLYNKREITPRWFIKHTALEGFYRYALSRGYINHSPMPKVLPKKPIFDFSPYVYSREELRRLFDGALTYQKIKSHISPYMVRVILILLYGTGLRLHEALSLTISDVDLSENVITVRETKFFKTRLVPFSKQLAKILIEYGHWKTNQGIVQKNESFLFITTKGDSVKIGTIREIFRRIRKKTGIHRVDKTTYQPRLHDLRHSFAVHRLTSWYQEKADVQMLLPILSVYMGHTSLSETTVYLTMTPELLGRAGILFETYATGGGK